ncbi:hypothetical protein CC86DRAFT_153031 [Ophiobolus disseminans]|uniref:Uncharacterized protein n=1 Tax=Ophiobolus disseminans TaxID=1469910 RepID=A0A6A6ZEJ2_9PLEO|nr:hypothetical protein CC86DRAFT_153031 [Ophiobolus disseminans]
MMCSTKVSSCTATPRHIRARSSCSQHGPCLDLTCRRDNRKGRQHRDYCEKSGYRENPCHPF